MQKLFSGFVRLWLFVEDGSSPKTPPRKLFACCLSTLRFISISGLSSGSPEALLSRSILVHSPQNLSRGSPANVLIDCSGGHNVSPKPTDLQKINKKKKARTTFTGRQIFELEKQFEVKKYLSSSERSELAKLLNVTETQVHRNTGNLTMDC